jgi:mono/diheme cytochrome c family protein
MKTNKLLIAVSVTCLSVMLFSACKNKTTEATVDNAVPAVSTAMPQEDPVKRGEYLVTIMGCADCHAPKTLSPTGFEFIQPLWLSGYRANVELPKIEKNAVKTGWVLFTPDLNASVGPWGISYAANITSDATGIGSWPEENFIKAMKQGIFKGIEGGRTLLPPMPWQNFAIAKDEDVKAIFAYLKSTPPVNNVVPAPVPPNEIK